MRTTSQPGGRAPSFPIVALTGFMAAGKSTVGRLLAAQLNWRFVDLDYEIEARTKLSIHEIFAAQGEPAFRQIECDALRSILENASAPTVIALGGGTFVQSPNAALLRRHQAHVVFLELDVLELLQRCRAARERSAHNPRPLAADSEAFCSLYAERLPSYRKAELTVNTHRKSAERVSREIAVALHLLPPKRP
ncbi:MAG TPA: shikimate kinase [Terriglobales bacterium]|jgi:shikimate kinase|nr:shikimate kinase [Terriglobales bacterium]